MYIDIVIDCQLMSSLIDQRQLWSSNAGVLYEPCLNVRVYWHSKLLGERTGYLERLSLKLRYMDTLVVESFAKKLKTYLI